MQALTFSRSRQFLIRMSRNSPPTLEDVAKLAKVSTATISRSINEPDKVAGPTRERIQQAIDALAYTPNFGAKVLVTKRSNTVGAIIPTMANAMFASGLQAFQEELARSGVLLLVASSGYSSENEFRQIQTLLAHGADGLLLIGSDRAQSTVEFLNARNIPYVISWCYRNSGKRLYAGFDNQRAAYNITCEVISRGHRSIAMIGGLSDGNDRASNRIKGVRKAIAEHRGARLVALVEKDYSLEAGAQGFDEVIATTDRPTAIVCGNDVIAAGALTRARQSGYQVPDDVSITGFDDINLATAVEPPLTTVRVPQLAMGRCAAELLMRYVQDGNMPDSVEFDTELVIRGSLSGPRSR
jgi:LacI family transcriptional regulator